MLLPSFLTHKPNPPMEYCPERARRLANSHGVAANIHIIQMGGHPMETLHAAKLHLAGLIAGRTLSGAIPDPDLLRVQIATEIITLSEQLHDQLKAGSA